MEKKNHTNYPQLGPQSFPQYSTNHHSNYTGFPQVIKEKPDNSSKLTIRTSMRPECV